MWSIVAASVVAQMRLSSIETEQLKRCHEHEKDAAENEKAFTTAQNKRQYKYQCPNCGAPKLLRICSYCRT